LALVFERLVEDVLARMASGRPQGLAAIHVTLDEWRELLRTAGTPLDRDTILGLIGELEILRRIGASDPTAALRAWKGPRRTVHDFVIKGHALEVKSTAAIDGNTVSVSNIDQLDPSETDELHLVVVHCKESDQAPGLDDRIRELLNLGFPRGQLLDAVADAGYVFESSVAGMPRFAVRSVRVWSIDADFPGLRRGDIPEERRRGVSRIRYDLALDSAAPRLKDAEASKLLGEWLSHDD
jgi:hypothetical protein